MPVYNAEKHLRESIDSVLEQTFSDFELIIVNDGSTDSSLEILKSYQDPRIKILNNKHSFIDSLNKGVSAANGEYIARMDSDDIMFPYRLQEQVAFLIDNPILDICGGWMETFGDYETVVKTFENHSDIVRAAIFYNPMCHPTIMMKGALKKLFPYANGIYGVYKKGYSCAEDYKLWIDLISKGLLFGNIPKVVLKYRLSNMQVTSVNKKKMFESSIKIQVEYIELIMEKIIAEDSSYYNLLNTTICLLNENKISFEQLKKIVETTAEEMQISFVKERRSLQAY